MTEPLIVTQDELESFRRCRRQWFLATRAERAPQRSVSFDVPELDARIVETLSELYLDEADAADVYSRLVERDRTELWRTQQDTSRFDELAQLGSVVIAGYSNWLLETDADDDIEIAEAERDVSIDVFSGAVRLDVTLPPTVTRRSDGTSLFFVQKPVDSLRRFALTAQINEQTQLLGAISRQQPELGVSGVLYNVLLKNDRTDATLKPPFYERVEAGFNANNRRSFWLQLQGLLRTLVAADNDLKSGVNDLVVAWTTPAELCASTCPYFSLCSTVDDASTATPSAV